MNRTFPEGIRQLAANFSGRTLDPTKITEFALQAAKSATHLNAFTRLTSEIALASSKESSYRYENQSQKSHLDGIPIAVKDNFCTKDIPTTCASKMLENFVPTYNATVVERLHQAGAVLLGKTNMDEFSMGSGSVDSLFGPVKNAWSEQFDGEDFRVAGGSSGGSAAAVAAGVCFAAIGSDTGGSVRIPASFCGVVGLKPTYGLISRHGLIPLANSMDVPGILAYSVDDCVAILNAISGPDSRDSTTIKESYAKVRLPFMDELSVKGVRVGIPKECHCEGLMPDVLETWSKVADMLEDSGACVKQVSIPNMLDSVYVYSVLCQCEVASNMARYDGVEYGHRAKEATSTEELYAKTRSEGFNNVVKTRILAGNYFLLRRNYENYYINAMKARRMIANDLKNVFECEKVDVILTPTTRTDAPVYRDFIKNSNRDQCAVTDVYTSAANLAGIPAVSLPIRLSSNNLPIGMQLMSNRLDENLLLRVAKWIESRVNFREVAPPDSLQRMSVTNVLTDSV